MIIFVKCLCWPSCQGIETWPNSAGQFTSDACTVYCGPRTIVHLKKEAPFYLIYNDMHKETFIQLTLHRVNNYKKNKNKILMYLHKLIKLLFVYLQLIQISYKRMKFMKLIGYTRYNSDFMSRNWPMKYTRCLKTKTQSLSKHGN